MSRATTGQASSTSALRRWRRALASSLLLGGAAMPLGAQIAGAAVAPAAQAAQAAQAANCPAILQHQFKRLQDDAPQDLCQYAGKMVLVVNTASYCGFTGQYEGLERLYERLRTRGLVVLGFPSNDFGQQEPGDSKQIADFCFNTYAVKFPMFAKTVVSGKNANSLFAALAKASGKTPGWNFHKYLIDRRGTVLASYPGEVAPGDAVLLAQIHKALDAK